MPRPTTPAPMTMVFGRFDGTTSDALMTDSLHRACPARFSGSDLSRPPLPNPPRLRERQSQGMPDGTPASVAISSRAPRRCKDFLAEAGPRPGELDLRATVRAAY